MPTVVIIAKVFLPASTELFPSTGELYIVMAAKEPQELKLLLDILKITRDQVTAQKEKRKLPLS